jgi:hypothetical protein
MELVIEKVTAFGRYNIKVLNEKRHLAPDALFPMPRL